MKPTLLALAATLTLVLSFDSAAASEEQLTSTDACQFVQMMLATDGINSRCVYQSVDGFGNSWLVLVNSTTISVVDTIGLIMLMTENTDRLLPSTTGYVLSQIDGTIYAAPMSDVRACFKKTPGAAGIPCALNYVKQS